MKSGKKSTIRLARNGQYEMSDYAIIVGPIVVVLIDDKWVRDYSANPTANGTIIYVCTEWFEIVFPKICLAPRQGPVEANLTMTLKAIKKKIELVDMINLDKRDISTNVEKMKLLLLILFLYKEHILNVCMPKP